MTAAMVTISSNKGLAAGYCFLVVSPPRLLPLASHGGEGREIRVLEKCDGRGSESSSALALVRVAEWMRSLFSLFVLLLLAHRGGGGKKESSGCDAGRITTQLGTPRGRYDEYNSKFSLVRNQGLSVQEKAKTPEGDAD
jgi:hypothetical protein